ATGEITNTILRYEYHARYFASHPTQPIIAVVIGNDSSVPLLNEQGEEFIVLGAPSDTLTKVVYSPDGRWLAIGTADDLLAVYDTYSWERHYVFTRGARGPVQEVTALTFSPDSQQIVSGGFQFMTVWDNTTFERLHTIDFATWVTNIIYSHDEDMLIVSDSLGQLWFLDSTTHAEIAKFEVHLDRIYKLTISPDGRYIVSASYDNIVQVWGVSG
ncbi:MAG: hypothetical protein KJ043_06485, partial [Anaerolineae bacterium]|nr:hypothetical protein [Anaerolineae bacterium]